MAKKLTPLVVGRFDRLDVVLDELKQKEGDGGSDQ
jgi:hypothetical protein